MEGRREGGGEGVGRAKKDRRRGRRRHLPAHEVLKLKICNHMAATGYLVYYKKNSVSSLFVSLKFLPPSRDKVFKLSLLKLLSYVRYYLNLRAFTKNDTYCFILVEKYRFQNLQISKNSKKMRNDFFYIN